MNLLTTFVIAALWLTPLHPTMPKGVSHEKHAAAMERDEALNRRGAGAMGFDQDATIHHFKLTADGGSIDVTVRDEADLATLQRVRNHLKSIAQEFARGDFGKPLQTHGQVASGVRVMQKYAKEILYRYEDKPSGGCVRIRTTKTQALQAVHDFLRYQIREHRTGDPVEPRP
jgi:hypothetical protein